MRVGPRAAPSSSDDNMLMRQFLCFFDSEKLRLLLSNAFRKGSKWICSCIKVSYHLSTCIKSSCCTQCIASMSVSLSIFWSVCRFKLPKSRFLFIFFDKLVLFLNEPNVLKLFDITSIKGYAQTSVCPFLSPSVCLAIHPSVHWSTL